MFLSIGTDHFACRGKIVIASFNSESCESFVSADEHAKRDELLALNSIILLRSEVVFHKANDF